MTRGQFWKCRWPQILPGFAQQMSDKQMEATARLVTVLLCGEQSAIQIFAAEISRSRNRVSEAALRQLVLIEKDEHMHECALKEVGQLLPCVQDQNKHKRRAQQYFASLGRVKSMSEHFAYITQLDTAVCKIMWHIESSRSPGVSPLTILTGQIKKDEARHVAVSRNYASHLGLSLKDTRLGAERINHGLVRMLEPLGSDFEEVGVDSDKLFKHLQY